jgi:hypothetical protein
VPLEAGHKAVAEPPSRPFGAGPCGILRRVATRVMHRVKSHVGTPSTRRILVLGTLLIVAALAFRLWALAGSWFYFDDLAFMSAGMNDPLSWHFIGRVYAGHLMPAGWLVIKGLATAAPYNWTVWAGFLLLLQAIASFGMLRLLRSMFGDTRVVLGLLTGYLFYIYTVPAGVWFAAGINQLPLQVALVFGLHAHLSYLRTKSRLSLVATLLWTVFGLAFYEKSFLLFGLYALFALCWFSRGKLAERLTMIWQDYRLGVIGHGIVAVPYLAIYLKWGLSFGSNQPSGTLISDVAYRLVGVAFSTGAVGGPLEWRSMSANSLADPSDLISLGSWVVLGSVVWYAMNTRTLSRRAWSLILFTLAMNAYLLSSARANLVGPDIGLEYRYQTESAAVFVLALGLAFLPLRGALEVNEVRPDVPRPYEREGKLRLVTVAVALLAVVSTLAYVRNWQNNNATEPYYDNALSTIAHAAVKPAPLVDLTLPQTLLWAFGYPENSYSHIFRNIRAQTSYPDHSVDHLFVLDDQGRLTEALIPPTRTMVGGAGCGYVLGASPTDIPLDGPVVGGGWWIRMEYGAPHAFRVRIGLGETTRTMNLPAGDHAAYFKADGSYNSVVVQNSRRGSDACVTQLTLGAPIAPPSS